MTYGYDEPRILGAIRGLRAFQMLDSTELPQLQKDVQLILAKHKNYARIQKAINSQLYMLMDLKNKIVSYDPITHLEIDYGSDSLYKIMSSDYLKPHLNTAFSEYNPHLNAKIYKDSKNETIFNKYNPPSWKRTHFYSNSQITTQPIPPIYEKFFHSLLDNDVESYSYLINWIANSLKSKNMKMLGAIGKQRIGKGLLAQVIAELHGVAEGNGTVGVSGTKFGKQFNGILDGRTFVEFSEFKLSTPDEVNNWKNLINTTFEIEKKGLDARMATNHVNIFITANNMRDVKIGTGDQRLSLINLTDRLLVDRLDELGFKTETDVVSALKDPTSIAQFAAYLWNYPVNEHLVSRVFESKVLQNLQKSQLTDWEKECLLNFCYKHAGQEIKVSEACDWLDTELNSRLRLKPKNFEILLDKVKPLMKKYPDRSYFELKRRVRDGSKTMVLVVSPKTDQPDDSFLENIEVLEEN